MGTASLPDYTPDDQFCDNCWSYITACIIVLVSAVNEAYGEVLMNIVTSLLIQNSLND